MNLPAFALVAAAAAAAGNGTPDRLPLAEAASLALARHPSVAAARARADVARGELDEARAAWFPSLSLGASVTRFEEPMVVTPIHAFTPGDLPQFDDVLVQGALTADWLLFDGRGRGARIDRRRALARAADADATTGEQALVGRVVATYLRALGLSATLGAHDRRLAALEAEGRRTRQLADVGRAPEVDVRRAEAALAAALAGRVRLASALDVAERDLARLTGRDVEGTRADRLVAVALADTMPPARDTLLARALAAAPDVRAAEARTRAASAALDAGRAARWPSVHAGAGVVGYGSDDREPEPEWSAGVRVQLPLFTGGAISSRIVQARAARAAAESELALARQAVEADADAALAAADEARARTASLDLAVARFEEVARIEKLRLDAEAGTQTDWLEAEAELLVARAQLVDARHAEIAARAELARIEGTLDPDWIDRTLEAR